MPLGYKFITDGSRAATRLRLLVGNVCDVTRAFRSFNDLDQHTARRGRKLPHKRFALIHLIHGWTTSTQDITVYQHAKFRIFRYCGLEEVAWKKIYGDDHSKRAISWLLLVIS